MALKSVLVVGGTGFVGTHLCAHLRQGFRVHSTHRAGRPHVRLPGVSYFPFSPENRNWTKQLIYTLHPDSIVFCGGSENIEAAERDPAIAHRVHADSVAAIAAAAEILQLKFIYLSSAYVFDGQRGNYREDDVILPLFAHGKAKIAGENVVRGRFLNHAIVRSTPLVGRGTGTHPSFLDRLRGSLGKGEVIELPDHELHGFASVGGLAELIGILINSSFRNRALHYGGLTRLTHYGFARLLAERAGLPKDLIRRAPSPYESQGPESRRDYSLNFTQAIQVAQARAQEAEQVVDGLLRDLRA